MKEHFGCFLLKNSYRNSSMQPQTTTTTTATSLGRRRADVLGLKQRLADSLGEGGKDYWLKLNDFLNSRCSRQELHAAAMLTFTSPIQARIHNKLLLAVMSNLRSEIPSPGGEPDTDFTVKNFKRRKGQDILIGRHLKRQFNQACIVSLPAEERARLASDSFLPYTNLTNLPTQESLMEDATSKIEGPVPLSCEDEGDLPSHEALKARMNFISSYTGLDRNFSDDAVKLVNQALENHLKNIITKVIDSSLEGRKTIDIGQFTFAMSISPPLLDADMILE